MKFSHGCPGPVDREVRGWQEDIRNISRQEDILSGRYLDRKISCQEDISTGRCLALPGSWRQEVREGMEESHASPWGTLAEVVDVVESIDTSYVVAGFIWQPGNEEDGEDVIGVWHGTATVKGGNKLHCWYQNVGWECPTPLVATWKIATVYTTRFWLVRKSSFDKWKLVFQV